VSEQLSWQDGAGEKAGPVRGRLQAQDGVASGAGLGAVLSPAQEK
jgi:hypothetical protein